MTRLPSSAPRRTLSTAASLLVLAAAHPQAWAQAEDPRPRDAKAACAAGQVDKGIALLAELYAETDQISWVYNQGRCYQQNGRPEEAINRFREYLRRDDGTNPRYKAEAEQFITELEQELRQAPAATTPAPQPVPEAIAAPAPIESPPPTPPVLPASDPETTAPAVSADSSGGDRRGRRALFISSAALAGAGVVALTGAILSGVKVQSLEDETKDWTAWDWMHMGEAHEDEADRYEVFQWIGYSAAGLAFAGSGLCLYLAMRDSGTTTETSTLSFLPLLGPQTVGGRLGLSF